MVSVYRVKLLSDEPDLTEKIADFTNLSDAIEYVYYKGAEGVNLGVFDKDFNRLDEK